MRFINQLDNKKCFNKFEKLGVLLQEEFGLLPTDLVTVNMNRGKGDTKVIPLKLGATQ